LHLLKRVLTALVLIPIVVLLVLAAPIPVIALVTALVALLAVQEFLNLAEGYGIKPFRWPTYIFIGLYFLLITIAAGLESPLLSSAAFIYGTGFAVGIAPFVFLTIGMAQSDLRRGFPPAMVSTFAFTYVALPLGFLVQLRQQWAGAILVLYLLLIVWAGDIFAYFVGKSLGRHRMSPRVSPKKTWEGAIASLLAGLAVGLLMWNYALPLSSTLLQAHLIQQRDGFFALEKPSLWVVLLLSAGLNIAAQLGDLVESLVKRGADVKDSGGILPGHGGMLDRIDALLFAAPVLWYFVAWRVMQ
jgi:phosphatidate cytidylyltransferase